MSKKTYSPWTKLDCVDCGRPEYATRTKPRDIDADEFRCEACESYLAGSKAAKNFVIQQHSKYDEHLYIELEDINCHIDDLTRALKIGQRNSKDISNHAKAYYYLVKARKELLKDLKESG